MADIAVMSKVASSSSTASASSTKKKRSRAKPKGKTKKYAAKKWTPEEDEILRQGVNEFLRKGLVPVYEKIVVNLSGRTVKQAKERWKNSLNPVIKKGEWSDEELVKLLDLIMEKGQNWTHIQMALKSRAMHCIKSKGRKLLGETMTKRLSKICKGKCAKGDWSAEEDKVLVAEHLKGTQLEEICILLKSGRPAAQADRRLLDICSCELCTVRAERLRNSEGDFKAAWTREKAMKVKQTLLEKIQAKSQNFVETKSNISVPLPKNIIHPGVRYSMDHSYPVDPMSPRQQLEHVRGELDHLHIRTDGVKPEYYGSGYDNPAAYISAQEESKESLLLNEFEEILMDPVAEDPYQQQTYTPTHGMHYANHYKYANENNHPNNVDANNGIEIFELDDNNVQVPLYESEAPGMKSEIYDDTHPVDEAYSELFEDNVIPEKPAVDHSPGPGISGEFVELEEVKNADVPPELSFGLSAPPQNPTASNAVTASPTNSQLTDAMVKILAGASKAFVQANEMDGITPNRSRRRRKRDEDEDDDDSVDGHVGSLRRVDYELGNEFNRRVHEGTSSLEESADSSEDGETSVLTLIRNYNRVAKSQDGSSLAKAVVKTFSQHLSSSQLQTLAKSFSENGVEWLNPSVCFMLDHLGPNNKDPRYQKDYLCPEAHQVQFDPFRRKGKYLVNFANRVFVDVDQVSKEIARGSMMGKHSWSFVPGRVEALLRIYYVIPKLFGTGEAWSYVRMHRCDGSQGIFLCHYKLVNKGSAHCLVTFQDVSDKMHDLLELPPDLW